MIRIENAFGTPLAGVRVAADILQGDAVFLSITDEDRSQTETTDAGGEARFLLRVAQTAAEDVAIRIAVAATDMFTYTVCDNGDPQRCTIATVTMLFRPPANTPPVAGDDSAQTIVNLSLDQPEPVTVDVLTNDRDADGDQLTVIAITQGAVGEVVLNADHTVGFV